MSFKFFVGQAVEYTPVGERTAGLYKIMRQMPKEEQAFDLNYLIKSEAEAYERNVLECQLSSDVGAESENATTKPRPSQGSYRAHIKKHPSSEATVALNATTTSSFAQSQRPPVSPYWGYNVQY